MDKTAIEDGLANAAEQVQVARQALEAGNVQLALEAAAAAMQKLARVVALGVRR